MFRDRACARVTSSVPGDTAKAILCSACAPSVSCARFSRSLKRWEGSSCVTRAIKVLHAQRIRTLQATVD